MDKIINSQSKYYLYLSVSYAVLMVTAQVMAYRFIQIGPYIEPGGIFVFPATFAISDIIAETYGPSLAGRTIKAALVAQAFFTFVPIFINLLPYPSDWHHRNEYTQVFQFGWLVFLSNLIAVFVGMKLNTQLIGKMKVIYRGKFFSLRSLFSTAIGELVLTAIIVAVALLPVQGFYIASKLFIDMFVLKFAFSVFLVLPSSLLVSIIKSIEGIDVYEESISLNPLCDLIKLKSHQSNVVKASFNK